MKKFDNAATIHRFPVGSLVFTAESIVTYSFDDVVGLDGCNGGWYLGLGTMLLIIEKRLIHNKNWILVLCARGPTWVHTSTRVSHHS